MYTLILENYNFIGVLYDANMLTYILQSAKDKYCSYLHSPGFSQNPLFGSQPGLHSKPFQNIQKYKRLLPGLQYIEIYCQFLSAIQLYGFKQILDVGLLLVLKYFGRKDT